jgi:hypothetical protein
MRRLMPCQVLARNGRPAERLGFAVTAMLPTSRYLTSALRKASASHLTSCVVPLQKAPRALSTLLTAFKCRRRGFRGPDVPASSASFC